MRFVPWSVLDASVSSRSILCYTTAPEEILLQWNWMRGGPSKILVHACNLHEKRHGKTLDAILAARLLFLPPLLMVMFALPIVPIHHWDDFRCMWKLVNRKKVTHESRFNWNPPRSQCLQTGNLHIHKAWATTYIEKAEMWWNVCCHRLSSVTSSLCCHRFWKKDAALSRYQSSGPNLRSEERSYHEPWQPAKGSTGCPALLENCYCTRLGQGLSWMPLKSFERKTNLPRRHEAPKLSQPASGFFSREAQWSRSENLGGSTWQRHSM